MTIITTYDFGDIVYVKTDETQTPRMVTEIKVLPGNVIQYQCSLNSSSADFYEMELSKEKDLLKSLLQS